MRNFEDKWVFPQTVKELGYNYTDEDWNGSQLRVIFVFPCEVSVKIVSATHAVLNNGVIMIFKKLRFQLFKEYVR